MPKVGTTRVPAIGPDDARIMVVGEVPGEDEEKKGEPFIERSGELLTRYFGRHNVRRRSLYMTNLCKFRPHRNKFTNLFCGDTLTPCEELAAGLEELKEDIERVKPNIIIAGGAWPMWYLTGKCSEKDGPGSGITTWRGSILPNSLVEGGPKVFLTYHPAYIVRPEGFKWNPVFHFDLGRAIKEAVTPDIRYPIYHSYIDPPDHELQPLLDEMLESEMVSVDIETFGTTLACVGFTSSEDWALCVTCENDRSWTIAEELLRHNVPKSFQFGMGFDIPWLKRFMGMDVNGYGYDHVKGVQVGWDTYVASATLMPEFPRGLDFLASIYTDFPFYKQERKTWKESGNLRTLWEYNLKDVIATLTITRKQQQAVKELFKV